MKTKSKYDDVVIAGKAVTDTAKASLMEIDGEQIWLPKSQFKKPSIQDSELPDHWTMFIPRWLAEEKELDYMEEDEWEGLQEEE